jgi:WD40 repeat protein
MAPVDPARVKSRLAYNHPSTFYALAADLAGGRLYAGGDDHAVHVFDLASPKKGAVARWTGHDNYVSALVRLPSSPRPEVVSASYDHHLTWWDTVAGRPIRSVEAHQGWVRDLAVTPDGTRLVSVGDDMLVRVWEAATGRVVHTLEGHAKRTPQGHLTALYAVAVSPDSKYLASGDRIGTVCVWHAESGKLVQRFEVPVLYTYDPRQRKRSIGGIRALAFSPDGSRLAAGGIGQVENVDGLGGPACVELWNWRKPERVFVSGVQGHKGLVNQLRFHLAGGWLIGAGGGTDNGFLAFWKTDVPPEPPIEKKDPVPVHRIKTDGHLHRLVFDPAGNEVYVAGYHQVQVWSLTGAS